MKLIFFLPFLFLIGCFQNASAQSEDSVYYSYKGSQILSGTLFQISKSEKVKARKKGEILLPIDGAKYAWYFVDSNIHQNKKKLLRRFLKGKEAQFYWFCSSATLAVINTWTTIDSSFLKKQCDSTPPIHWQTMNFKSKFNVSYANMQIHISKLELNSSFFWQTNFITVFVPPYDKNFDSIQVVLVEPY